MSQENRAVLLTNASLIRGAKPSGDRYNTSSKEGRCPWKKKNRVLTFNIKRSKYKKKFLPQCN